MFKVNNSSQQELLLSCYFFNHVSSNINKMWLLLCYLRVPFINLRHSRDLTSHTFRRGTLYHSSKYVPWYHFLSSLIAHPHFLGIFSLISLRLASEILFIIRLWALNQAHSYTYFMYYRSHIYQIVSGINISKPYLPVPFRWSCLSNSSYLSALNGYPQTGLTIQISSCITKHWTKF